MGVEDGSDVPIMASKAGLTPYVPWIRFTSAGLMGAARARRVAAWWGIEGDIEWVCSFKTSPGSPNLENTRALVWV